MKKLLSFILILTLMLSLMLASNTVLASDYHENLFQEAMNALKDDDCAYFTVHISTDDYPSIYNYPSWVMANNLLPDVKDYTASLDEELFENYKEYVHSQYATIKKLNEDFFAEHFTHENDKLMFSASDRGYLIVYVTKAELLKVRAMEKVATYYHGTNWSQVEWRVEEEGRPYFDVDLYTPQPYELVYALHFYKDQELQDARWYDATTYMYSKLYSHFPEGTSTEEEATPDYVMVFAGENACSPAFSAGEFGDYLLQEYNIYYPYIFGYHIITTDDMRVMTLTEAYNENIEGIMDVFENYGLGTLRGDANFDGKITVRDATRIQKGLAEIEPFTDKEYVSGFAQEGQKNSEGFFSERVSDFNRDGKVNIRDATNIQKYLAKVDLDPLGENLF